MGKYDQRTVFVLRNMHTGVLTAYGSLKALTDHNDRKTLGVALPTLYTHDFNYEYMNGYVTITKLGLISSKHTAKRKVKKSRKLA